METMHPAKLAGSGACVRPAGGKKLRTIRGFAVQGVFDFLKALGPTRLAAMGAVTAALIGFFAFMILRVTAPQMTPLFTDLSTEDSAAIIKDLERQAIVYEMRNEGAIIMVPKDRVTRLRMSFAESGLPKGGGVGYEIFDKSEALGTTSFVQNINHLRALEGELARTIRAIDRVQAARVHLVLPERPLFSREKAEPSASIVLKVRGMLDAAQVRAIRHLVASAVNGLKPQRVSIVDEAGNLLADGAAGDEAGGGSAADDRQVAYERRLRQQVENIVSSVVGPGRARVQLTAEFDFNRITQTSDKFDPDGRVVRSTQTREETAATADNQGQVTVGNELPGAGQNQAAPAREQSKKSEEIVNYDISRTTETKVIEGGRVNRVSVAVLVDGAYTRNDKGEPVYNERPKEELDRIAALVRSAIGFDQKRGDQVEVVNLRFADVPANPISEPTGIWSMLQFTKDDVMRTVELGVMFLLGIVVLLLVVRPLVRRIVTPDKPILARSEELALPMAAAGAGVPQIAEDKPIQAKPSATTKMIEIAQVQGQVHAQSVQKVGDLAERNPNETAAIVRQWLHEPA
jgi:flagellar M-ring protein FliF